MTLKTRSKHKNQTNPGLSPLEELMGTSRIMPPKVMQHLDLQQDESRIQALSALGLHDQCMTVEDYESEARSKRSPSLKGSQERDRCSSEIPLGQKLLSPLGPIGPEITSGRSLLGIPIVWETLTPKWNRLPHISAPAIPMSEDARRIRRGEKRPVQEETGPSESEWADNPWKHYTQIANEICALHCKDVMNFDPYILQRQLRQLSEQYLYKHTMMPVPSDREPPEVRPEVPFKKVHHNAMNRITLQRVCDGDLQDGLSTSIPDQGIRFDKDGNPWDKKEPHSHDTHRETHSSGSPNKPVQSHTGYRGTPGGNNPGDGSSSDDP
jgi:hypothetical protein